MLTEAERLRLIGKLERAAQNAIAAQAMNKQARCEHFLECINELWEQFPECRNENPPSAMEVLAVCIRIRAEIEADKQFNDAISL